MLANPRLAGSALSGEQAGAAGDGDGGRQAGARGRGAAIPLLAWLPQGPGGSSEAEGYDNGAAAQRGSAGCTDRRHIGFEDGGEDRKGWGHEEREEGDEEDEPISAAFAGVTSPRGANSRPSSARVSFDPGSMATGDGSSGGRSIGSAGVAALEEGSGSMAASTRQRRSSLMRVKTPGVLLAPHASSGAASEADSPREAAGPGGAQQPAAGGSVTSHSSTPNQQQRQAAKVAPTGAHWQEQARNDASLDEVLCLEPFQAEGASALLLDQQEAQQPRGRDAAAHAGGMAPSAASAPWLAESAPPWRQPRKALSMGVQAQLGGEQPAAAGAAAANWDIDELEAELVALSSASLQYSSGQGPGAY
jgi:hypothetical protein